MVRVLETAVRSGNCTVLTETAAEGVERNASGEGFRIRTSGDTIEADMILLAAGGKAAPKFGTTGDGYRLAKQLGHHVTRLYPILTGIECGDFRDLKGIRARGKVTLLEDGQVRAEETGEIQFTQDGLSGICVFNLTPQIHAREGEPPAEAMKRYRLSVDLAPDFTQEQIKDWKLPVLGIKGWNHAQCTAGGVCIEEVDMDTMESRLVPGLYFAGEIIDAQGPCGGFNLQNAWETWIKAARAIAAAGE